MRKYVIFLLSSLLFCLSACADPEDLLQQKQEKENISVIETYSDSDVINLSSVEIKLISTEVIQDGENSVVALQIVLVNKLLDNGEEITKDLFSVTASQSNVALEPVDNVGTFTLEEEKKLEYQFVLNSENERVIFEFNAKIENGNMTKHYDLYLE